VLYRCGAACRLNQAELACRGRSFEPGKTKNRLNFFEKNLVSYMKHCSILASGVLYSFSFRRAFLQKRFINHDTLRKGMVERDVCNG
jgi:hypothetical protein